MLLKEGTSLGLELPPPLRLMRRHLGTILKTYWMAQNMVIYIETLDTKTIMMGIKETRIVIPNQKQLIHNSNQFSFLPIPMT